jgi:hypothetical protein
LGVFTKASGEGIEFRCFHGKEVLLDDGVPNGADVRFATQDRDEVGLAVPLGFDFANEPIQPKSDPRGSVLHSLRVFQDAEALMGIVHGLPVRSNES